MEALLEDVVQNGLGVASFCIMVYFIFRYQDRSINCMEKISDTLTDMQVCLSTLTDRVDKIEEKINRKGE